MADICMNVNNEREAKLKAFDETMLGVKGLVDGGLTRLPEIFRANQPQLPTTTPVSTKGIPVIDMAGLSNRRKEIIKEVTETCMELGVFQVVNHGIPQKVLDDMIQGARSFHEWDSSLKKPYYARGKDDGRKFTYISNVYLYTGNVVNWRDTTVATIEPLPTPQDLPPVCSDITIEYGACIKKLGTTLLEILSEGLGLNPTRLKEMDSTEACLLMTHYYPPCPEPELAIGINKHTDNVILTLLLQDEIGGLQVFHDNQWIEVPYVPGAIIINTGDLLKLLSNDKYQSVIHKVQPKKIGPRVSIVCFLRPKLENPRLLSPIEDLISEENPPIYKGITTGEYLAHYYSIGQDYDVEAPLERFKIH